MAQAIALLELTWSGADRPVGPPKASPPRTVQWAGWVANHSQRANRESTHVMAIPPPTNATVRDEALP